MKGKVLAFIALLAGVGVANAAVRNENNIVRNTVQQVKVKSTPERVARTATPSVVSRNTPTQTTTQRTTVSSRTARTVAQPIANRQTKSVSITRNKGAARVAPQQKQTTVRSATVASNAGANLGTGYTACRDAYFTCMDQFCGAADDTYRRCICSSKLTEIQSRERALSQTEGQLQDFQNLNLAVIDKTAGEVGAMLSATAGEIAQSNAKDKSDSAKQLSGISDVLSKTKTQSLSTQGTLDIAGDINAIWSTTDLTGGTNISNLTGEALYNAVHAQCSEMVSDACPDAATKTMVVSAYGMYIENDCSLLINGLDKKLTAANTSVRNTEYEMGDIRLENYNAHNSTSINDCIAQVRSDITSNVACGADYIHCLDVTGRYLNYETGTPIYTSKFFELNNLTSLSGDLLTNQANRVTLARLQGMRNFAERGLDTCRDISDDVWDEFLRQAITEIHQGQQARIRQVKDECLDVVNKCYDEQNQQLKDFTNTDETLLLGSRLELSEKMCQEKLDACSNVYGGGTNGLNALLVAMHDIISQQIAQQCVSVLQNYLQDLCTPPSNDTLHAYPYGCRMYEPTDLEKKLTQYAQQTCVRPSVSSQTSELPHTVLQDIRTVNDQIKVDMAKELSQECARQDGKWISYKETSNITTSKNFYNNTSASQQWGICTAVLGATCEITTIEPKENRANVAEAKNNQDGACVPSKCYDGYVINEDGTKCVPKDGTSCDTTDDKGTTIYGEIQNGECVSCAVINCCGDTYKSAKSKPSCKFSDTTKTCQCLCSNNTEPTQKPVSSGNGLLQPVWYACKAATVTPELH